MFTQRLDGESVFEALADEWDALAGAGMTDTPFQTLAYQRAWWHHLQPQDGRLYTITVRDADQMLKALACFYLDAQGSVHFNGCIEETDYLDLIARPGDAEAGWTAVLDCLLSDDFPAWRQLDLCNVPDASPTRALLPRLAAARGLSVHASVKEVCPVITLPKTFDAYLESLDSKQRREVQRKLRKAAGADAAIKFVGPQDNLETAVDDFLKLLQKSTFEKRDWLTPGRRAVFHAAARAALEAGTLQLMFIEVDGLKAAALFNFDYKNRIWVYNSGLDPMLFTSLSPGVVLTAKAIEYAIENGRDAFDFLRGGESYKYRFGAVDTTIYRLQVTRQA